MLREIKNHYTEAILQEAMRRFGFAPDSMQELEGSAFVYEGLVDNIPRILKITPGIWNTTEQITGSTLEQFLAELDFILYLAENGVAVALPVRSKNGEWVETIPLDEQACFLVDCFEKAGGIMYPDDDEVYFPEPVLIEWGRVCGRVHQLSTQYQPHPSRRRLSWNVNDLLDFSTLIPSDQVIIYKRRDEILERLSALPQSVDCFGMVHGDFHHGNFFVDGNKITLFDFDAADYYWYTGEICTALHNCLPMPRSKTGKRRDFAVNYLRHFLRGYCQEKPFDDFWLAQIRLFLQYCELLSYAYFYKYWDMTNLSELRTRTLADVRRRLEDKVPVVEFQPEDLPKS